MAKQSASPKGMTATVWGALHILHQGKIEHGQQVAEVDFLE
jgi:hypothetical protein